MVGTTLTHRARVLVLYPPAASVSLAHHFCSDSQSPPPSLHGPCAEGWCRMKEFLVVFHQQCWVGDMEQTSIH